MAATLLSRVEDVFEVSARGIVIVPGIPREGAWIVNIGDPLEIRGAGRKPLKTYVAGIEMMGRPLSVEAVAARQNMGIPILLGSNVSKADVPIGAEIWLLDRHPHPTAPSEQARKASYPSPIKEEDGFISALRTIATHPAARGLRDDAAVLEFGGETLVLTHDVLVEGVHILPDQDPADIAWKLVAVNLSDLAAKGAEPVGVLLGHMLGDGDERFLEGLREVLDAYNVPLLGGDTVSAGDAARSWGLTAIGRATHTPVPSRGGAEVGDSVWLTGPVGAALLGFEALRDGTDQDSSAYRRPHPLLIDGQKLAPHVTALMDVSDGLLLDCWRMATASLNVAIELKRELIPVAAPDRFEECIRWGDDYQLLFTAPAEAQLPVNATRIGSVTAADFAALWLDDDILTPSDGLGYQHGS